MQAKLQADKQATHENLLAEILGILKKSNISTDNSMSSPNTSNMPEVANPTQAFNAGGSLGVTGHCQQ
jgi:hypothetical protein